MDSDLPDRRGFVLLWRKFWDNPDLKEPGRPFSKREAWLYLFSNLANGIDRNGVPRGEFEASERYLSKAWLWSKTKVHLFLQKLEADGSIKRASRNEISQDRKKDRSADRFIICNYELYQKPQTVLETTKKTKSNKGIKEGLKQTTTADEKPFILIPLKTGEDFPISETMTAEYEAAYPNINVKDNLRRYRAWALSNPNNRKTKAGILRSVNGWLSRENETGKSQALLSNLTSKMGAS